MNNEKTVKPGYMFQTSMQIGGEIALTVSGNFAAGSTTDEMVIEMDKVLAALEKQNVRRMKLPAVRRTLQDQRDALVTNKSQLEKMRADEAGRKLSTAEKVAIESCMTRIETLGDMVAKGAAIIVDLEKEAA
ncbi:hypothetical protein [Glaciimonas immobilis]|uniref:Uncharacterized protein n=1 Tax=Glaciimonas immobilis TaxID=728004 RepID=A0A840RV55_9BURK|nr:hypothetical protein [Glaciimonas immobilis]KAF3997548.1 hypothetical protein HAV38_12785 [Glaciimonas immobilis]MBB5200766.1 hypothetical protein [Glaciimonas immobilis]